MTTHNDALYVQAVETTIQEQKCSTSLIQRRLAIGYNKAAPLVEQMENAGIVTAHIKVGKRDVLAIEIPDEIAALASELDTASPPAKESAFACVPRADVETLIELRKQWDEMNRSPERGDLSVRIVELQDKILRSAIDDIT